MTQSNAETMVEVSSADLPLHCPTPNGPLWNSHPRVFIPIEESGESRCPYCGTVYRLVESAAAKDS
ncbi:MAG: zinc-finger domain-containing protein [Gammaproteobacteria bacterium]|nr:zinc-finger domain-containing protein [Gammaproteobacteria bacterium]